MASAIARIIPTKRALRNSASITNSLSGTTRREGRKSIIIGVPPNFPPRKVNGICVGCFLTPDPAKDEFTLSAGYDAEIRNWSATIRSTWKTSAPIARHWLRDQIFAMSRSSAKVVRHLLAEQDWDYFHFVDIGLDRIHHGFWNYFDKKSRAIRSRESLRKRHPGLLSMARRADRERHGVARRRDDRYWCFPITARSGLTEDSPSTSG